MEMRLELVPDLELYPSRDPTQSDYRSEVASLVDADGTTSATEGPRRRDQTDDTE